MNGNEKWHIFNSNQHTNNTCEPNLTYLSILETYRPNIEIELMHYFHTISLVQIKTCSQKPLFTVTHIINV